VVSDKELIERWKKKRDYMAYKQLKDRHKRMVYYTVNRYAAASVPRSALEAEGWKLFDDAVNNYKPNAGAKFSTYLNYQLRKLDRYTKKYQNIARIPEALSSKIGDYDRASQTIMKNKGRQPTHSEMSNALNMPVKQVKQLHKSRRGDLYEGKFEHADIELNIEKGNWLLRELRDELNPQERQVYDHLIGHKKQKITNKKKLAAKLNMSPGRISQITRSIAVKIKPHLNKRL